MTAVPNKPLGFEADLSEFRPCMFDSGCGEAIAWGFKIIQHLEEKRFAELREVADVRWCDNQWFVITKTLTRQEAAAKYGSLTAEEYGPRGGWRSVTFGQKKFLSKFLRGIV